MNLMSIISAPLKVLLLLSALFFISCGSDSECDADSLFSLENASGTMTYLSCFDSWVIRIDDPQRGLIVGASMDIDESFEEEGLKVCVDACFLSFDLPLVSPLPTSFDNSTMSVIENFTIERK